MIIHHLFVGLRISQRASNGSMDRCSVSQKWGFRGKFVDQVDDDGDDIHHDNGAEDDDVGDDDDDDDDVDDDDGWGCL